MVNLIETPNNFNVEKLKKMTFPQQANYLLTFMKTGMAEGDFQVLVDHLGRKNVEELAQLITVLGESKMMISILINMVLQQKSLKVVEALEKSAVLDRKMTADIIDDMKNSPLLAGKGTFLQKLENLTKH
jgi:uncharacterized protein YaaW (UPF0174 family)